MNNCDSCRWLIGRVRGLTPVVYFCILKFLTKTFANKFKKKSNSCSSSFLLSIWITPFTTCDATMPSSGFFLLLSSWMNSFQVDKHPAGRQCLIRWLGSFCGGWNVDKYKLAVARSSLPVLVWSDPFWLLHCCPICCLLKVRSIASMWYRMWEFACHTYIGPNKMGGDFHNLEAVWTIIAEWIVRFIQDMFIIDYIIWHSLSW